MLYPDHLTSDGPPRAGRRTANRYLKGSHFGTCTPLLDNAGRRPRFLDTAQIESQIDHASWMFEVVFDYDDYNLTDFLTKTARVPIAACGLRISPIPTSRIRPTRTPRFISLIICRWRKEVYGNTCSVHAAK